MASPLPVLSSPNKLGLTPVRLDTSPNHLKTHRRASRAFQQLDLPHFRRIFRTAQFLRMRESKLRALTESAELPLESVAPSFKLLEPLSGKQVSSDAFQGAKALLVIFMCNHCPFVILLKGGLVKLANDYKDQGVQLVGISSNSTEIKPQDGPEEMATDAKEQGYPFPYLYDADQEIAKKYQARCTPEFFLFDKDLKLQYHGQFDSARPSNGQPVTGQASRCNERLSNEVFQFRDIPLREALWEGLRIGKQMCKHLMKLALQNTHNTLKIISGVLLNETAISK